MTNNSRLSILAPLLLLAAAACGGASSGSDSAPAEGEGAPIERTPLTDADFAGLDRADLSLEIPWTGNRVTRDPAPAAGPSGLVSLETSEHETFDRIVFGFSSSTPFPGYEIDVIGDGTAVRCGAEGFTVGEDVSHALVVRFAPARLRPDGPSTGETWAGGARLGSSSIECVEDGGVMWIAPLGDDSAVRVLELRDPPRVVVDVR